MSLDGGPSTSISSSKSDMLTGPERALVLQVLFEVLKGERLNVFYSIV